MKKYLIFLFLFIGFSLNAQVVITQTFVDKCSGEIKIATTTYVNGNAVVIFYNQIKTFTPVQIQNGELQVWLQQTYLTYNAMGCTTNVVVQQTVQQTVNQSVQQATSSTANSATSSVSSLSSSSSESKSESKSEEKKESKKKVNETNPLLFGSDLSFIETSDRNFNAIISLGLSKSSLMGNESYSVNSMIWSNLTQFALSGGYTKMDFDMGKLNAIHSYSLTTAYLSGNYMGLIGYTFIKPHPKYGTYGYNIGLVNLFLKSTETSGDVTKEVFNPLISSSLVTFWTKQCQINKKLTLSPQVFVMSSPLGYNPTTGKNNVSRDLGFLVGSSFDYKISKRFGLSLNYKVATSTVKGAPFLSNFLIGSRLIL